MLEIFQELDKDDFQIIRRSEFIIALRTDERVMDFLDREAVKVPYSKRTLTLDDLLTEVERDETYEQLQTGKHQPMTNNREFFSQKEFLGYFYDFKEVQDRNRRGTTMEELKAQRERLFKKDLLGGEDDKDQQFKTLLEQEKERRLALIPRLRPAD